LDRHDIADEDTESSMEAIAKEYNRQDGAYMHLHHGCCSWSLSSFSRRVNESIT
jgi:hypothetical protein